MGGTTAGAPSGTTGATPDGVSGYASNAVNRTMMSSLLQGMPGAQTNQANSGAPFNKALSHSGAQMTNVWNDQRPNPFQFNSPFNQSAIGDPRNFGMGGGYGGPAGYGMPNPFQRPGMPNPFQRPGMPPGGFARPAIPSYGNPGRARNAALPRTPQQEMEMSQRLAPFGARVARLINQAPNR